MVRIIDLLVFGSSFFSGVVAKPFIHTTNYAIKETHDPPAQWKRIKDAPKDGVLNLRIGLKMDRWDELERRLYEGKSFQTSRKSCS